MKAHTEINDSYIKAIGDLQLTPKTSPWMHDVMKNSKLPEKLYETYGSPINFHHLPSFVNNIKSFQKIFDEHGLYGQIYFARKANKSKMLVKEAIDFGIGVDTASYKELKQAIDLGGHSKNLVLTAAIKNRALIELAISQDITVIIDNLDELQLINQIAGDMKKKCRIGIRISGFEFKGEKLYSRFGFDIERDIYNLKLWFSNKVDFPHLILCGIHFHLDGYSIEQRAEATIQALNIINEFRRQGNAIEFLDIGGGILINYLESAKEWNDFKNQLRHAVLGKRNPITFKNNGLGFSTNNRKSDVEGKLNTYPYYNEVNGPQFLESILNFKDGDGNSIAALLKNANVQLRIEPGRSLLDQVGITMARVAHRKVDAQGNWMVGLEMNMSQLNSASDDFLLDPFVVYRNHSDENEIARFFLTGAYCLESDLILKRELLFPRLPSRGDYVFFVNTAGYLMHFYERQAHLFDFASNLYLENSNEIMSMENFKTDVQSE